MSRLNDLIRKFCPNGVLYKQFDEACTLNARIGWQRLTKAEHKETGDYLLITGTDFTATHEINYDTCVYVDKERYDQDSKIQIRDGDVLITKDGTLGKVAQVHELPMPATLNGGVFVVRPKDNLLLPRYILHFLLSNHFQRVVNRQKTGSTICHLTQGLFSRLLLPVPPQEVQREIVRILDNFTELTAELTARKKQYEFYKEHLLTFGDDVRVVPLADIANIEKGKQLNKEFLLDAGKYPVFNGGVKESGFYSESNCSGDAITVSQGGASAGFVNYQKTNFWAGAHCFVIYAKEAISQRFLYHFIKSKEQKLQLCKYGAGIPALAKKELDELRVPVLPIDEQKRIASVLDRFDALCNDISIGLPAEIEARRKQYEYYRDKLLTFPEKV